MRSDLPGLRASLPGLRPDLPGWSVLLSGKHVLPLRGQDALLPRCQDGRQLDFFPGHMQEFSRTLLRPTLLQQPTRPLHLCPRTLRAVAPWMPGMPDVGTRGLELRCQRAGLPSTVFHPVYEDLKIGSLSKVGPMQEVSRTLLRPTPLQQPTRPLQLWPGALCVAALGCPAC